MASVITYFLCTLPQDVKTELSLSTKVDSCNNEKLTYLKLQEVMQHACHGDCESMMNGFTR